MRAIGLQQFPFLSTVHQVMNIFCYFVQKKLTSCYKWWRLLVVILIAILFGTASIIVEHYRIQLFIFGTILCLYKAYCFWIVNLYIATIGTAEKDSEMTLPTVCSELNDFTQI